MYDETYIEELNVNLIKVTLPNSSNGVINKVDIFYFHLKQQIREFLNIKQNLSQVKDYLLSDLKYLDT